MGNAVNYLRTLKSSVGSYSADPKLENIAFVNGLVLSTPLLSLGRNFWIEYSVADTRYTGSDLYNRRYDEVGVAIARSGSVSSKENYLRAGLSYLDAPHSRGVMFNFHYTF